MNQNHSTEPVPKGAERVLFKTSRQRVAEKFLFPAALLPIGPLTRTALGDRYSVFHGIAVTFAILFLLNWISSRLAPRLGGEWISRSDRLRLYAAETTATSRWVTTLSTATMFATILFAFLLLLTPLDQLGDSFNRTAIIFIAVVSVCAALLMLRARTALRETTIELGEAPTGYLRQELLRMLPWSYAATALATTLGLAVAFRAPSLQRSLIFFATASTISILLRALLMRRLMPKKLYALTPAVGDRAMLTLLASGVPMAIIFSGLIILELWNRPTLLAAFMTGMWIVVGIGSLALGVLIHWWIGLVERRPQGA